MSDPISWKNKKNINNLLSAEFAWRVEKVNAELKIHIKPPKAHKKTVRCGYEFCLRADRGFGIMFVIVMTLCHSYNF